MIIHSTLYFFKSYVHINYPKYLENTVIKQKIRNLCYFNDTEINKESMWEGLWFVVRLRKDIIYIYKTSGLLSAAWWISSSVTVKPSRDFVIVVSSPEGW